MVKIRVKVFYYSEKAKYTALRILKELGIEATQEARFLQIDFDDPDNIIIAPVVTSFTYKLCEDEKGLIAVHVSRPAEVLMNQVQTQVSSSGDN